VDEKELREIYSIINDIWLFIKCHSHPVNTDAFIDGMIAASDDIWFRHNKSQLCRDLLIVCMKYIEKKLHNEEEQ